MKMLMRMFLFLCLAVPTVAQVRDQQMIYVSLGLMPETVASDNEKTMALRHGPDAGFTAIILALPAWQMGHDSVENPLVKRTMSMCEGLDLDVVLMGKVFVNWPNLADPPILHSNLKNSTFYAVAFARIQVEAARLGADATAGYLEPHGKSPEKDLKAKHIPLFCLTEIRDSVSAAVFVTGKLDYAYWVESHYGDWLQDAFQPVSATWLNATTYRIKDTANDPTPPTLEGFEPFRIDVRGTWISQNPEHNTLTPEEFYTVAEQWGGRTWVYIMADEFEVIMQAMARVRTP